MPFEKNKDIYCNIMRLLLPFPGTQKEANRAAYFNMLLEKLDTLEGEDLIHE